MTLSIIGPTLKPFSLVNVETQSQENGVMGGAITEPTNGDLQFASLAPPSGGHFYFNRNDMDKEIGESVDAE